MKTMLGGKTGLEMAVVFAGLLPGLPGVLPGVANAELLEFTDRAEWEAAVGEYTTLDFTGFPVHTRIQEQYAHLGVHFTECFNTVQGPMMAYPNDMWGLDGNEEIHLEFDEPQLWIAADYPGMLKFVLYYQGEFVYEDSDIHGMLPHGNFLGLLSDQLFDEVLIYDWWDLIQVNVDDIHFGVPAPGTVSLLTMGFLFLRRRRA